MKIKLKKIGKKNTDPHKRKSTRRGTKYWASLFALSSMMTSAPYTSKAMTNTYMRAMPGGLEVVYVRGQGQTGQAAQRFDIPSGALQVVLDALQEQTGWQVVVPIDAIRTIGSPGASGNYRPEQALKQILTGTGVTYKVTAKDTVTLEISGVVASVDILGRETISSPKYTEPLRNVPQTISVIPKSVIEQQGATTLRDVLRNVPGLTIVAGEGGTPAGASLLLAALSHASPAQSRIALTGRVADSTGAAINGATVTARQPGNSFERSVNTDGSGNYRLEDLLPGEYQITARGEGFSLAAQTMRLDAERSLDFTLRPGALVADVSVISTRIAATLEEQARIPGSIEIIDARTLEISRPFNFNEALRKVPGVYTRDEEGFGLRPSISIRGLDPNRSAKVLLLEDGVPLGHAPYGDTDAYYHPPIERYNGIEILKGSSQIAHGPNTLGGAINYLTPAPPEKFGGSLTLIGGSRSYFNGYGSIGASFGEGAGQTGVIFDFLRKQGQGARENMRFGLNDVLVKTVTKLNAGGTQTLGFKFNYYGEDSNVTYSGLTLAEFTANPRANPFRNDFFYGDRFGGSALYTNAINSKAVFTATLYGSSFGRDWWRQSSNSDQRPNRRGSGGCNGLAELNTLCGNEGRLRKYDTFGIDPRLKISSRAGETDLGFRYHRETQNRIQQNNNTLGPNGRGGVTVEDNQRKNSAVSGYIQHRFLFGKLAITPGVRVEHVNIERTNKLVTPFVTGKTDVTQAIPGIGLAYSPTERFTVFAGAHRGFSPPRPADIISGTGGVVELDPELSWNYEVGFRSLPARGLRLSAAFFRLDYENQIVPANLSGGIGSTLTSAGETLHQGLELDARWDSGVTFNSPHNFYVRTAYTFIGTAEYRGSRFSNVGGFNTVSITGKRLIYSPKHLATTTLGYSHASGFDALIETIHTAKQFGDDLNTVEVSPNGQRGLLASYTVWNATVNYRIGKLERYAPTVFVAIKNLADDTFIVDRRRGIMVGIPRLVQAGVKLRF
ncbi:MAG: TonB-dependent receptor [Acidobacteriota bacterium]|nr:TonB-dependent receptor [Acidobacteriota bacterium]